MPVNPHVHQHYLSSDYLRKIYHDDIDGVTEAIARIKPWSPGDELSDCYRELWEIATEPDNVFRKRRVMHAEASYSQDEQRRAKIIRRLGILEYASDEVQGRLEKADATLIPPYHAALGEIATAYEITHEEISARAQHLAQNRFARPWFLTGAC